MEIERKYLIETVPFDLSQYPLRFIEQGYLCTEPVVRVRRDNDKYELTYKSKGLMVREEHNIPISEEAYQHLKYKVDGLLITKKRYMIPLEPYTIELDVFTGVYTSLILAEVEFPSEEAANSFVAPSWFGEEVTLSTKYHNSTLSKLNI